jgi:hypothetical protein
MHAIAVRCVREAQAQASPEVRRMTREELWAKDVGELARLYQEARTNVDQSILLGVFGVLK